MKNIFGFTSLLVLREKMPWFQCYFNKSQKTSALRHILWGDPQNFSFKCELLMLWKITGAQQIFLTVFHFFEFLSFWKVPKNPRGYPKYLTFLSFFMLIKKNQFLVHNILKRALSQILPSFLGSDNFWCFCI